jgi:hypothetical protein|tara:strand:+ start:6322 stop:6594 length:273 start_codon:yes stop_codon:yes gene_type:complete
MKIEVDGHTIQIKPINYVDRLGIKGELIDIYKDGIEKVTTKAYYLLLGSISKIAFDDAEKSLKDYDEDMQLKILTAITNEYVGQSDNQKK